MHAKEREEREEESVHELESSMLMSLASNQIYNLHFYIIGLCFCGVLIVHSPPLLFCK